MTEERKFAILFAATILSARKLLDMDPDKPSMAKGFFVDHAIDGSESYSKAFRSIPKWNSSLGFKILSKRRSRPALLERNRCAFLVYSAVPL
jgi:hypothetical protein